MKKIILTIVISLYCILSFANDTIRISDASTIPAILSDKEATVFIVVRHGEKAHDGKDPHLDSNGLKRAQTLQHILSKLSIDNIYATPYNRTKETVKPTADSKNQTVQEYSPMIPYKKLTDSLLAVNKGKKVLIVGHSNTVPGIVKALSHSEADISIAEDTFDNIYIVIIPKDGHPVLRSLKYGK